jgi:hypothetical protein
MALTHSTPDNITLGRGRLYFAPFLTGTTTPQDARLYLGNTPGCNLTGEVEKLDHYTADTRVRAKDRSITIEANYSGTVTTDNISVGNLAMFFLGSASTVTTIAATNLTFTSTNLPADSMLQLGATAANPSGARNVTNVAVTGKVLGTDYELDAALGQIRAITAGVFAGTYDVSASTRDRVISAGTEAKGLLQFVADNPEGTNRDIILPYVTLSPNGDFAIKGDGTDWTTLEFNLEVLKKDAATPAVIIDGRPA